MVPKTPAQVCWIFSEEDEPIARELLDLAAVLEAQGLIENSSIRLPPPGTPRSRVVDGDLIDAQTADVVMMLAAGSSLNDFTRRAIEDVARRTRLIQVLVRPARWSRGVCWAVTSTAATRLKAKLSP